MNSLNSTDQKYNIWDFFNPFSEEFKEAEKIFHEDFSKSPWHWKQAVVVITSTIGALFFIAGAFPVFRWTVTWLKSEKNETDEKIQNAKTVISPVNTSKANINPHPEATTPVFQKSSLIVGTYNVLFPQKGLKNGTLAPFSTEMGYTKNRLGKIIPNTNSRMKIIIQNLHKTALDIICLQEVVTRTHQQIHSSLSEYASSEFAPHHNKHGVTIFYKKSDSSCLINTFYKKPLKLKVLLIKTALLIVKGRHF